ncbi:shikimate kinase [Faecalibacter rhinopitheci]|uniref:Shikimate kinase n=1 Tax=Faecalibacter rhinopitheci TaxID=2779678 RepID=A0A8J7FNT0_9FLAO|nr:shikimate kinase [Faecalibacter rhinopitheci]MBF0597892.1 shikimate kinase [Faecalibacter rhinopitheci]MBQ0148707.1 shikimate kinase [Candidatus Onthonaster equi]
MIISLIGYMGSGKSTTGKDLAKTLGYEFIDLDQFIEQKYNLEITDIFSKYGEIGFRKREREALHEVLQQTNLVLSLGGGTPVYYDNMDFINKNSESIFLRVQLPYLVKRLESKKHTRPLIAHLENEDLMEFIAKHLFERNQFYQKAKYTISITTQSTYEVLNEIMEKIKS